MSILSRPFLRLQFCPTTVLKGHWPLTLPFLLNGPTVSTATAVTVIRVLSTCQCPSLSVRKMGSSGPEVETPLVKISVCQLTSKDDKVSNLATLTGLIEAASQAGSKMVFFPEGFDYIAKDKDAAAQLSEPLDGPFMTSLKGLAKAHDLWLSLGGFHEKLDTNRSDGLPWVANTHVIVDNQGDIVSTFQKVHLFDMSSEEVLGAGCGVRESDVIKAGSQIVKPIATPLGNVGLGVCYDLRFPEFGTTLRAMGADILAYPAAFTVPTGQAHWETLLRARAIENQCYVIAAAQIGQHNEKRRSYGHSMVVDPWGKVIAEAKDDQSIMTLEIDSTLVKQVRRKMEVFKHRRDDVYAPEIAVTVPDLSRDQEIVPFGHIPLEVRFVFMESALSRAFVNKKCILPGHVLIITKRVAERMVDLRPAEIADFFQLVQKVQKLVESVYGAKSSTVAAQDGPDAGQTVKHFHIHVIPRTPGDFDDNDTVYAKLASHDKGEVQWRSDEEMENESKMLRTLIAASK